MSFCILCGAPLKDDDRFCPICGEPVKRMPIPPVEQAQTNWENPAPSAVPTEPVPSAIPAEPAIPAAPAEPVIPAVPMEPMAPETPTEPVIPEVPAAPMDPPPYGGTTNGIPKPNLNFDDPFAEAQPLNEQFDAQTPAEDPFATMQPPVAPEPPMYDEQPAYNEQPQNNNGGGATPPPPAQPAGSTPDAGGFPELMIKALAAICAVILLLRGVNNVFGGFGGILATLAYFNLLAALATIFRLLAGVCDVVLALLLALFVVRKTREFTDPLFAGVCGCAALIVVVHFVRSLLLSIDGLLRGYSVTFPLDTFAGCVLIVIVLYSLLRFGEDTPLVGKTTYDIADDLKTLPAAAGEIMRTFSKKTQQRQAARPQRPQPQQPAPGYQQPAPGYQQPAPGYQQPAPGYQQPAAGYQQPAAGYQQPAAGYQQPAAGYQQPAAGYQQPAAGYQQPAAGYQQPGGASTYTNLPSQMLQTNRSLLVYILLTIVTCGIYSWYFLYKLAKDVNVACDGDGQKTSGLLAFIVFTILTCGIYGIWWHYKIANRLQANAPRYGLVFPENGTSVLLWLLFGWFLCGFGELIGFNIIIKNANALCTAYNAQSMR